LDQYYLLKVESEITLIKVGGIAQGDRFEVNLVIVRAGKIK